MVIRKRSLVGFEVFEIIILVILVLTLAYWLGKRMCGNEGCKMERIKMEIRREKFEKLRIKFEQNKEGRTFSMVGATKKEVTENPSETKVDERASTKFNYC